MDLDRLLSLSPATAVLSALVLWTIAYIIGKPIYNIFFHPLRKYPGPFLWRASHFPYQYWYLTGRCNDKILDLHRIYGDVVRVGPGQLSFQHADAWKEIMGHKKGVDNEENGKDPTFYAKNWGDVVASERHDHARMRRVLSHGFSAQSMEAQQPLISSYIDLLIRRLHEMAIAGQQPINMVAWYNYTTFDIIGDLAFGEPFDCLNSSTMHPWVEMVFASVKQQAILTCIRRFIPCIDAILNVLKPKSLVEKIDLHDALVKAKVVKRQAQPQPRPDFMASMMRPDAQGNQRMSQPEIEQNSSTLIIAGSETTASALSAATYYLCMHPETLKKLVAEVRGSFSAPEEINLINVNRLKYMLAVLDETMRIFPPLASALPRECKSSGDVINGQYVAAGTILDIWQWVINRNPNHFTLPDSFIPERWTGTEPRFANDRKDAVQPFSHGPRNCLGKNLAYAEMRLILARVIWNFDLELDEKSRNWPRDARLYTLWDKPPLYVHLRPRKID
ncbi:cytochrome P450 [Thelonectria olida]|uniref:Cytochrome P450 n=1 Tax=Thelonectria olida TaxID=1576542 RepID=A0A9P9ALV7_9HYPO|nr:cytochrome P450 [Thelonectria olida]